MYSIDIEKLISYGLGEDKAKELANRINHVITASTTPSVAWREISSEILSSIYPFPVHLYVFSSIYPHWQEKLDEAPAWIPDSSFITTTNIAKCMAELNIHDLKEFHTWSVKNVNDFWGKMLETLSIYFQKKPSQICYLKNGIEYPSWLVDAKMNIVDSCFNASPDKTALIYLNNKNRLEKISYKALEKHTNRIAHSLITQGFKSGDPIAIYMPMTKEAVFIYLGIIKMGGIVVAILDSFSSTEMKIRLEIANTKIIFTQDYILRDKKKLSLYEKILEAKGVYTIVLPCEEKITLALREGDLAWKDFLSENDIFETHHADPHAHINILFSSGTTGIPKAIPWNHTTGIKSATDAYFHQNIQSDDILCWPTNLGWMMGPWLIFATFINQATMAIYSDAPRDRAFGQFVQDAKVTMLGVVPVLVSTWRQSGCMEGLDWSSICKFSSSAECSNAEDMLYLMSLANYKPIIEYCGGTETGGGYISSTLIQKNYPSLFTTPVMGIDFVILDEEGKPSNIGEAALIPPAMGLSFELLNGDHHEIYYASMPTLPDGRILRRHGDQIERFASGNYRVLGRIDDTMKLGGIKISAVEIERVITGIEGIFESAAVAIPPKNSGPSLLVIYAATKKTLNKEEIKKAMQSRINENLNPLFKIHDIVLLDELPKTPSNKIIRRILRKNYQGDHT